MYDGLQDPLDHLMHYRQVMMLQVGNDAFLCKVFPSSLVGPALSWFHRLAVSSITSFRRLFEKFVAQYMHSIRRRQRVTSLFHVRMGESETACDFMKRFGATNDCPKTLITNPRFSEILIGFIYIYIYMTLFLLLL